jgi:putative hydrolase of the HAD superfamily
VRPRAVVFDLWETLVDWQRDESQALRERWAARVGLTLERFDELWYEPAAYRARESGPLAAGIEAVCAAAGSDAEVDELIGWRLELTRRTLVPRDGVYRTLAELRRRGLRLGLVSNCSEDVALVWPESRLAPHFDAAVFSATAGCMKPDARIFELLCAEVGVEPESCLFVGDGANDELEGARRTGMTPVLIHRPGEDPPWPGLRQWSGLRITSIPEVLELVE